MSAIWAEFQEAVVIVVGEGILLAAAFAIAGAVLLATVHLALTLLRRLD